MSVLPFWRLQPAALAFPKIQRAVVLSEAAPMGTLCYFSPVSQFPNNILRKDVGETFIDLYIFVKNS